TATQQPNTNATSDGPTPDCPLRQRATACCTHTATHLPPQPDHSHPSPPITQRTAAPLSTQHQHKTSAAAATMAPITATIVPLVTLFVGSTTAFVTPTGRGASWSLANPQH
ncbi:unnamed protein product, partial [Ectocarpus sp. 8 AP-2014]